MQDKIAKILGMPLHMEGFVDNDGETMQDNPEKEFALQAKYHDYYMALYVLAKMIECNDVKIEFIDDSLGKMNYFKKLLKNLD